MKVVRWIFVLVLVSPIALGSEEPAWNAEKRNHWAWRTPTRPTVPLVKNNAWVRNPIDAFVLAQLESAGVTPAPEATRPHLIRRATFDLIGLPPTPEEIDAFLRDRTANAWEKVVERLLASPQYGERWGRHWLDLARFAESNGFEFDEPRPNAWRYRDYVIASFNADKPYDRFVQEQLAGDELFPGDPQALIATGFNLLGPDMTDASSQVQRRQNTLNDMTDTAGLVFLGLTVGCARCHNHKFEPISASDYFRLQAFFVASDFRHDLPVAELKQKREYEAKLRAYHDLTRETMASLEELEAPYRKRVYLARLAKLSDGDRTAHETPEEKRTALQKEIVVNTARRLVVTPKEVTAAMPSLHQAEQVRLQRELKKFDAHKPAPLPTAMAIQDRGKAPKAYVLKRGELQNPGEEVQPGWLTILSPGQRAEPAVIQAPSPGLTGRRSALAKWITRKDHPLTARVMVNRIWQHHFGRGVVATPNDFGLRGTRPTHPALLDWLAVEFMSPEAKKTSAHPLDQEPRDWSIKRMHRLVMLSATYQQSTSGSRQDPENKHFSRMNRQRLEGEVIRDALLAVSGRLNLKMGGQSVFPPLPREVTTGGRDWKVSDDPADHGRRSVYIFSRRNLRFPFLEPFDLPDSNQSCPKRERSTTANQALALLNASEVNDAANALAARVQKTAANPVDQITQIYRLALGRNPTAVELRISQEFLADSPLHEFSRAILNVNEFVYLD